MKTYSNNPFHLLDFDQIDEYIKQNLTGSDKIDSWLNNELKAYLICKLPANLKVGSLGLTGLPLLMLPDNLNVAGRLLLENLPLLMLPNNLKVDGNLYLKNLPKLETLPDNLIVEGYLSLNNLPQLTNLPDNLKIGGNLYLENLPKLQPFDRSRFKSVTITNCPLLKA